MNFLDIITPNPTRDFPIPPETKQIPIEKIVDTSSKASFFEQYQTTLIVAALLILAIAVVIITKAVLKKELKNA